MNYQTGDYIRFHAPEQWQQIVEKLERDGEKIYNKHSEPPYNCTFKDSEDEWDLVCLVDYHEVRGVVNDITDKFFEDILQDELRSNPPLEVGDEFTCTSKTYAEEDRLYTFKKLEGDYYFITWGTKNVVTDYSDQEIKDWFKITSYKQANPVQEYSVQPKIVPQVNWKELQETYVEFSIEQSKKFMENWLDSHIKITYCEDVGSELTEVENTFNNILTVNRKGDYVETVSVFSDHSEATFYYWKDCEVVGDVTLNKIELQHYLEKLQKMLSDMD